MGEIKDIVDLVVKLRDEVGDRKIAAVLDRIQPLLISFQSSQVSLMEKHAALLTDNLDLTRKTASLESEVASLKAQLEAKPKRRFQEGYAFNQNIGLWVENGGAIFYCSKCFAKEILSPVQNGPHGWKCRSCGEYFADAQRPEPPSQYASERPKRLPGLY